MKYHSLLLLLALPVSAVAADRVAEGSSSSKSSFVMQAAPMKTSTEEMMHGKYLGSIAFSGVYSYQTTLGIPGVNHKALFGWAVTPEVNFTKHLGLQADFVNSYTENSYPGITRFMIAAGPRYTFNPYWKATPFLFGEAGETRISYGRLAGGTVPGKDWNPTASAGIGMDFNVSPNWAIQLVPGEWTGERFDYNGAWQHTYMARVGFVFKMRK